MSTKIKIVAIVVTTDIITLYKENGDSFGVKYDNPSVPYILETLIPELKRDSFTFFDEEKMKDTSKKETIYSAYEKKSKITRFFSIAKDKLASLFESKEKNQNAEKLKPMEVGAIPPDTHKDEELLNEVLRHANTSDSAFFDEEKEEVIAVVDNQVIPNVKSMKKYINHSVSDGGDTSNVDAMLTRLSKVIGERRHSAEDLLKFLEAANLPIAANGDIIAYKNLKFSNVYKKTKDTYVDIHSGRVTQRVGSRVCVPKHYVNENRSVDCAQGLHIASASYLSGFRGDVCVMVRISPEDFMAVPEYSTNKARVRSYDILCLLTKEQANAVYHDYDITKAEGGKKLLEKALNGGFPEPNQLVTIKGRNGTDLVIEDLNSKPEETVNSKPETKVKPEIVKEAPKEQKPVIPKIDPKSIEETKPKAESKPKPKPKAKAKSENTVNVSNRQKLLNILGSTTPSKITDKELDEVLSLKKKSKKSYKALGVPEEFLSVLK